MQVSPPAEDFIAVFALFGEVNRSRSPLRVARHWESFETFFFHLNMQQLAGAEASGISEC